MHGSFIYVSPIVDVLKRLQVGKTDLTQVVYKTCQLESDATSIPHPTVHEIMTILVPIKQIIVAAPSGYVLACSLSNTYRGRCWTVIDSKGVDCVMLQLQLSA